MPGSVVMLLLAIDFQVDWGDGGFGWRVDAAAGGVEDEADYAVAVLECEAVGGAAFEVSPGFGNGGDAVSDSGEAVGLVAFGVDCLMGMRCLAYEDTDGAGCGDGGEIEQG